MPDYDHLPVGSLGHRIRSLGSADLRALLAYERAHADRLAVRQLLETRVAEVDSGAEPSEGEAAALAPEQAAPPSAGGPVSPETQGPPQNPPPHGNPTNRG